MANLKAGGKMKTMEHKAISTPSLGYSVFYAPYPEFSGTLDNSLNRSSQIIRIDNIHY